MGLEGALWPRPTQAPPTLRGDTVRDSSSAATVQGGTAWHKVYNEQSGGTVDWLLRWRSLVWAGHHPPEPPCSWVSGGPIPSGDRTHSPFFLAQRCWSSSSCWAALQVSAESPWSGPPAGWNPGSPGDHFPHHRPGPLHTAAPHSRAGWHWAAASPAAGSENPCLRFSWLLLRSPADEDSDWCFYTWPVLLTLFARNGGHPGLDGDFSAELDHSWSPNTWTWWRSRSREVGVHTKAKPRRTWAQTRVEPWRRRWTIATAGPYTLSIEASVNLESMKADISRVWGRSCSSVETTVC